MNDLAGEAPGSRRCLFRLPSRGQMLTKEVRQLIEGNDVHAVVEIDVTGCGNPNQLLRFDSALAGVDRRPSLGHELGRLKLLIFRGNKGLRMALHRRR